MGVKAIFDNLVGRSASVPPIAYVADYQFGPTAALPNKEHFKGLDGLLLWHIYQQRGAAGVNGNRLITYWASADHYARDASALEGRLGVVVTAHGYVGVMGTREIAWWKRVKPTTVILSLAALLGAVEVIGSRYERLFAVPDLSLKMERQKFDVVEATELAVVVNVHNELSTEQTDIQLSAELVGSDGKVREVRLSEDRLSQLAKSSAKEVKAVAVAPMSGSYKLRVRANSKAGWLRPRKPFETTNDVEVWPEVPSGTVALKNGGQGQGVLRGTLRLGHRASNGLNCEWQIDKVPDLVFDGLFDLSVKDSRRRWSTDGKGENSVALLRWDVAAVPTAMSVLTAELVLKGPVSTDWTTVARQSSLVCRYSKEAIRNE